MSKRGGFVRGNSGKSSAPPCAEGQVRWPLSSRVGHLSQYQPLLGARAMGVRAWP